METKRSWILIGMMGSGKSTIGRAVAEQQDREFLDTDHLIAYKLCRTIPQIFKLFGEPTFREHETATLRRLQPDNQVISTGGGIVLREENWTEMKRLGNTIYLKANAESLIQRLEISRKKRPLLSEENWEEKIKELVQTRDEHYQRADATISIDHLPIEKIISQVVETFMKLDRNGN